jgi:hypothetical protein
MKVQCPSCSTRVPAANINLEVGWGKCEACHELFALERVVPGFPAPGARAGPIPRPFNARAIVERTAEALLVHVPAEGMRASGCGLLGFATFWLGFVAFWTVGALGLFGGQPPGAMGWCFATFSIPFWLVGFWMAAGFVWAVWGTKSLRIDRDGLRTYQRCLAWWRTKWVALDCVQHARPYDPQIKTEGVQEYAVEVVYRAGSFILPTDSAEEERWLIFEINEFVRVLAAESRAAPDPVT